MKRFLMMTASAITLMGASIALSAKEAEAAQAADAKAAVYRLELCADSAHRNCQTLSKHATSGACESAKKAYLREHPKAIIGCL